MANTFAGFGIASSKPPMDAIMLRSTLSPGRNSSVRKPLQWPGCFVLVVGLFPGLRGSKGACSVAPRNRARRDEMDRFFWCLSDAVEGRGAFFRERRGRCLYDPLEGSFMRINLSRLIFAAETFGFAATTARKAASAPFKSPRARHRSNPKAFPASGSSGFNCNAWR